MNEEKPRHDDSSRPQVPRCRGPVPRYSASRLAIRDPIQEAAKHRTRAYCPRRPVVSVNKASSPATIESLRFGHGDSGSGVRLESYQTLQYRG